MVRPEPALELACPLCRGPVCIEELGARCTLCGNVCPQSAGIWRFLPAPRAGEFASFLRQYRTVRQEEGWGSPRAEYYRALPYVPRDDPQRSVWRLRARSFQKLLRLLAGCGPATILDVGAGNCWLANQLALRGYTLAALDISDDPQDGLGAAARYRTRFGRYQADFDRLPFGQGQFDAVIANAALHYSPSLADTLGEARRVLAPQGRIVVLDSPFYSRASSGRAMLAEREADHACRYGCPQPSLPMVGFLTAEHLERAAAQAGLGVSVAAPDDGWRRRAQRALAWIRTGREPARFPMIVLQRA